MEHNSNRQSPAISVIVPVYKVEPYLRQCIDSILAQTFRDFELILVDDGSPDNCGAICDEYAEKDDRIVVIHQENAGLSAARNTGLDWIFANSESMWITFVDSDDMLAPIMLETLHREAIEHQSDIAQTYGETFVDEADLASAGVYVGSTSCIAGKALMASYYRNEEVMSITAWGKLIRRNLFQSLRFPVGKIHEDEATTPILMFHAEKVAVNRSWLYFYRQRPNSVMSSSFSLKRFDVVDVSRSCAAYFKEHEGGMFAKLAMRYHRAAWARMVWIARREGIYNQVPAQYRMHLVRVFAIILVHSLRYGGIQFVLRRIQHLFRQLKKN